MAAQTPATPAEDLFQLALIKAKIILLTVEVAKTLMASGVPEELAVPLAAEYVKSRLATMLAERLANTPTPKE